MTRKILQRRMLCSFVLMLVCLVLSVYAQQPYRPDWESLKSIPVPRWFDDAKFGIFIHWGPQAVSESNNLRLDSPRFGYKDIIPLFKAESWDPNAWAELFHEAGARYVVLTGEHHDGYALWDSQLTQWCATKIGPKRDLVGELAKTCRARGLRFAPSYHRERHNGFFATATTRFLVKAGARDTAEAARRIESFVAEYITNKSLSVGYASAAEVVESRQGDCSEFAVLTAALCRAAGIPAEVVVGMAYVKEFAGIEGFGGHAWARAYVGGDKQGRGGRWIGLDAAFKSGGRGGYDAGHIALATGDGEPGAFFNMASALGQFTIENIKIQRAK